MLFFLAAALLPVVLGVAAVAFLRRARRRATAAGVSPTWPALAVGNTLVLLAAASLAFVAFEAYYRFAFDETDSWGIGMAQERWFQRHWHENAQGTRDNIDYVKARGDSPRVSFLGDSFTAGHGVKDVERRFVNIVRRERAQWEVHSLAFTGSDTPHQTDFVKAAAENGYEFETVVLVYCLNDIGPAHPRSGEVIERIYARSDTDGFLVRNSYAVNTLYHRYRARNDPEIGDYFAHVKTYYSGMVWREQERRLDELRYAVEREGGRLLVVTFPFLQSLGGDYAFAAAHEVLGAHWKERGVPHLDLLPVFIDREAQDVVVNRYDSHPNETGHALAAKAILDFLDRELR